MNLGQLRGVDNSEDDCPDVGYCPQDIGFFEIRSGWVELGCVKIGWVKFG